MSTTCAICLDDIVVETTGCTTLSCKHEFHFSCLCSWFMNSSSCPCCRNVVGPLEDFPPDADADADAEEDDDSDYEEDDDDATWFGFASMNTLLRSRGGQGIIASSWNTLERINDEIGFYTLQDLNYMLIGNGAHALNLEEWAALPFGNYTTEPVHAKSYLMLDGTWRNIIHNPEEHSGVVVVVPPTHLPDDFGMHASVIAYQAAKKLQKAWRNRSKPITLQALEATLISA